LRSGFTSTDEANDALQEALKQRKQNEKFGNKVPTVGTYADERVAGLKLAASTITGYKKIIRNHISPPARRDPARQAHRHPYRPPLPRPRRPRPQRRIRQRTAALCQQRPQGACRAGCDPRRGDRRRAPDGEPGEEEAHREAAEVQRGAGAETRDRGLDGRAVADLPHLEPRHFDDELFPLWRLIAYTGMRRSEALALKWSDINTKTMRVSIRRAVDTDDWTKTKTTKTGQARVIDVDTETLKVLASYKVARAEVSFELAKADAYIFGDDDGKLRSPDAMTSRWDRRLKWATAKFDSLHRVTIKGLRHTHATLLLELGEHPKVVQERLGHSTITTTMNIYSHVTPTMQRSAVDRFAAHLNS
jgi:integrase